MTNVLPINSVMTFDDLWKAAPGIKGQKGSKILARAKFEAITSADGLSTKMRDHESGEYVPVHLKATPDQLLEGMLAYRYLKIEEEKFIQHVSTWLNRGGWLDRDDNAELAAKMRRIMEKTEAA